MRNVKGKTNFPWRTVIVAENDYELTNSDMVYKLATPSQLADISWIKPGKVAWDWWNDWNLKMLILKQVLITKRINTTSILHRNTAREHVILDEGWAVNLKADLFQVVPKLI